MKYKILIILLFTSTVAFSQTDKKLTCELEKLVSGFNGQVGVYVENLKTGKTAAINPDNQ